MVRRGREGAGRCSFSINFTPEVGVLFTFRANDACGAIHLKKRSMLGLLDRGLLRSDWTKELGFAEKVRDAWDGSSLIGWAVETGRGRSFGQTVLGLSGVVATIDGLFKMEFDELGIVGVTLR